VFLMSEVTLSPATLESKLYVHLTFQGEETKREAHLQDLPLRTESPWHA